MKKIISQVCSISILAASLNVTAVPAGFAATPSRSDAVREVMANYSLNLERGESSIKSIVEATTSLQKQGISSQELVDYVAEGMDPQEAKIYKSAVASRIDIADSENLPVLLREISDTMSKGSNFRGCTANLRMLNTVMFFAALTFVLAIFPEAAQRGASEAEKKKLQQQKTDLEFNISVYLNEGVRPDSILIASVKKDIDYLDQQIAEKQDDVDASAQGVRVFAVLAAASATVWGIGEITDCN